MSSFLKLTLGASLAGDLPINAALSIALPGYSSNPKYYNAAGNLTDDDFKKLSGLELGVNVGTTLSDIMIELGVTLKSLKSEAQNWLDAGGDGTADTNEYYTSEDSQTNIDILVGKKIKANETLTVLIGSGLNISLFGDTKATLEDKVAGTKEYSAGRDSGMEIVLPLQVAVQCKLNETWSWSAGVNKDIFSMISANNKDVDTTDGSTVTDESDASSMAIDDYLIGSICLTGQFGDLKVQWLFNYNLLLAGPYFISGQNNSWAYNFALVYDWK
jgi:hypothetical protein